MAGRYGISGSIQAEYFFTHWQSILISKHNMPKEVDSLVFRLLSYSVSKAATQAVRTFRKQSQPFHYMLMCGFPLVNYFWIFEQGPILSAFCAYYATQYHSHLYHIYFNGPHYRNRIPIPIGWPLKLPLLSKW
jgi:hypothetical protein